MGYYARNGKYYAKKETRREYEARKRRGMGRRPPETFEGEVMKNVGGGILLIMLLGLIF